MHRQTIFESLELQLAAQQRRVVSEWRTIYLLQQAAKGIPVEQRRWSRPPVSIEETRALLTRLAAAGNLLRCQEDNHLYTVTSPYAAQSPVDEYEILMELHPFAAISHLSALVFHHLTDELPTCIHASIPSDRRNLSPVGLQSANLEQVLYAIKGRITNTVQGTPVLWHRLSRFFGHDEYTPNGYPIRVTTIEKTLIDGLASPDLCGGFINVLKAWVNAKDMLNLKAVLRLTDQLDVGVVRQRVGFVLEKLGFSDPRLEEWTALAQRGGSSKILGSAPSNSNFDERWKLSLNAPIYPLMEGNDE